MNDTKYYIISALILLILDFIWITMYMGSKYETLITNIQGSSIKFNLIYAIFAYLLMIIGLYKFVLPKINLNDITFKNCFFNAFLFGVVLYGVYNFTLLTIFKKWDIQLAIIDISWGGLLYFLSCYLLKFI